jgi:hypothetical protein
LPIYKNTYKLIQLIFRYTKEFTRKYKFNLKQDIHPHWVAILLSQRVKCENIKLVRSVYRTNRNANKRPFLEKFR